MHPTDACVDINFVTKTTELFYLGGRIIKMKQLKYHFLNI
jgi:hypothetical protein